MAFADTYLGRLRQRVGQEMLITAGAMVIVQRADGLVLVQRRADNGDWEFPAGASEPDQTFVGTAVAEVAEETGIVLDPSDLEAFACMSDPELQLLRYPNGDIVRAYTMCFLARVERAEPRVVDGEATDHTWVSLDDLPTPTDPPAIVAARLLHAYLDTGLFQAR